MKPSISGQWNPPHGRKLRALWDGHLETNSPDALGVFHNIPWWNLPWWWNHHFETTQVGWKKLSISQAGAAFPGKKSLTVLPNVPGFETNGSKSWSIFGSPQKVLIFCCLWWIFHCFANSRTFFMSYPVGWGVIAFIAHHPAQTSRRLQNSQVTLHGFQQRQVQDTWSGNGAARPTVE